MMPPSTERAPLERAFAASIPRGSRFVRRMLAPAIPLLAMLPAVPVFLAAQPLQNRLLLASSRDGLAFTKLHTVVYHSADVPDAVVTEDGRVFLYFQGNQDPVQDAIMVGISVDGIGGWSFQPVSIAGIAGWRVRPCDPDVLYRDGMFRLYFTGDPLDDHIPETYSAVSGDGVHFTLESGVRFSGSTSPVLDPSLLWIADTLHFFAGGGGPDRNWHAVSTDGLAFTRRADFSVEGLMMSNGIRTPGGYRFYGFTNRPPPVIQSLFTADGITWTKDPGVRLTPDSGDSLEAMYVKDPAIVLRDSLYLMYYVSRKREFTGIERSVAQLSSVVLHQNYPNPAYGSTSIPITVREHSRIVLTVHDILGRMIATLADAFLTPGEFDYTIDASELVAGVYVVRLQSNGGIDTRLMQVAGCTLQSSP